MAKCASGTRQLYTGIALLLRWSSSRCGGLCQWLHLALSSLLRLAELMAKMRVVAATSVFCVLPAEIRPLISADF
jgi:hypothetical protein